MKYYEKGRKSEFPSHRRLQKKVKKFFPAQHLLASCFNILLIGVLFFSIAPFLWAWFFVALVFHESLVLYQESLSISNY